MSLYRTLTTRPHLRLAALLTGTLALAGCGSGGGYGPGDGGGYYYVPTGTVVAENDTATLPETVMYDFRLWFTGTPPSSSDLLSAPLYPGEWEVVAEVDPDYYDADAFMSDGIVDYLEVWDGIYVDGEVETTFFAY